MQCEMYRSAGFDVTGEWAVECGADGEYCPICEMVVCSHCHKNVAGDANHLRKKTPAAVKTAEEKRRTG